MESMESRTCLHFVLERAVGHASRDLEAAGLSVTLHAREPIWLPETGTRVYRPIRRLLGAVCTEATPGPLKIDVLDLVGGKSHVEVTVTFRAGRSWRVLSSSFPRC